MLALIKECFERAERLKAMLAAALAKADAAAAKVVTLEAEKAEAEAELQRLRNLLSQFEPSGN